jgi:hypothetical protein
MSSAITERILAGLSWIAGLDCFETNYGPYDRRVLC